MPLTKSTPAKQWIHDFVHSKNKKFEGKSKKERIKQALGAYYAKQRNESYVSENHDIAEKAKWRSSSAVEPNPRHDEYEYDKKDPYRTSPIKSKADTEHPYASLSTRPQPHIATKGPNKGKMTKQSAASLKNRIKASLHHEETHTGKVPPSTVSATEGAMKTPNPKYRNMVMVTLKQPKTLKGKLSKKGGGGVFRIHKDTYNANRTKYDLAEAPDAALAQQQKQVDQRKEQLKKQIAARVAQKQMQVMQQKAQKRLSMIKAGDNAVEIKNMKGKCSCNHEDTTNCPVHGKSDQATAKKTIVDMNPQSMY